MTAHQQVSTSLTESTNKLAAKEDQPIEKVAECKKAFENKILQYNAIACSDQSGDKLDQTQALTESEFGMTALRAQGGLQQMLVAQMTSIHLLQQKTIALANRSGLIDSKQYFANSAIKLANCFTQQAALLAKLQGAGGQKIIVEHVEVHHGGQAIVGTINRGMPNEVKK